MSNEPKTLAIFEDYCGEKWSIREIIETLSLCWHRASAFKQIIASTLHNADITSCINMAIAYLEALKANDLLIINSVTLASVPTDIDKATVMPSSAVCGNFNIGNRTHLTTAITYILGDANEFSTATSLKLDIGLAITSLKKHLDEQNHE